MTIPNSVTSIGNYGFDFCSSLTSVTIPNSVTSIGGGAFLSCSSLTSVTIPNSVTSIGDGVFQNCTSLTSVTIPNSITSIGESAFAGCTSLTSVTIPNSVTSIGDGAFSGTGLTNITIPSSVTSIGDGAFESSGLKSVTIPNTVTSIGNAAFAQCNSLTNATIDNGVTSIGSGAFEYDYGLSSVTIPGSVTSIGDEAFYYCSNLTSVTIPNSVTNIGDGAFESSGLKSVTIPNTVTSIGDIAFGNCFSLTNVTIPNSVTNIGSYAFSFCGFLTSVYFTGNAPSPTNDSTVFSSDPATVYYLPGTTGWGALFDGLPTAPWFLPNPLILNNGPGFGVQPGGFGFTISWATNVSVVVEAATNLANPVWIPVSTNTLTGGTNYFSDPQWTNYPARFYRITSKPTFPGITGNLDVDMYNAAVADGTDNGGVPAVMGTENGGPFRVTAGGRFSNAVCRYYSESSCKFTTIVGTTSCSSTTLPSGTPVIQFGTVLECGFGPYHY